MCARPPSTLARNSSWKPVVTASTIVSAATPTATPRIDTLVNTENVASKPNTAVANAPTTAVTAPTVLVPPDAYATATPTIVTIAAPSVHHAIKRSRLPP